MHVEISYDIRGDKTKINLVNEDMRLTLKLLAEKGDIFNVSMSDEDGDII